jgi:hypothetical protein
MRFNSWDVVFKPWQVYQGIGSWVADPWANSTSLAFPLLFGTFVFITYLMLYALTHLQPAQPAMIPQRTQVPAPEQVPALSGCSFRGLESARHGSAEGE